MDRFVCWLLAVGSWFGLAGTAAAAELQLTARLDWRSQGEIYQVWFHREFDGLLVPTAPVEVGGDAETVALLSGADVACSAYTQIGLPNWSVTTAECTLRTSRGEFRIAFSCDGSHARCDGTWRIVEGEGVFNGMTGTGDATGYLLEPMPLPWFWDGPIVGYTELRGLMVTK